MRPVAAWRAGPDGARARIVHARLGGGRPRRLARAAGVGAHAARARLAHHGHLARHDGRADEPPGTGFFTTAPHTPAPHTTAPPRRRRSRRSRRARSAAPPRRVDRHEDDARARGPAPRRVHRCGATAPGRAGFAAGRTSSCPAVVDGPRRGGRAGAHAAAQGGPAPASASSARRATRACARATGSSSGRLRERRGGAERPRQTRVCGVLRMPIRVASHDSRHLVRRPDSLPCTKGRERRGTPRTACLPRQATTSRLCNSDRNRVGSHSRREWQSGLNPLVNKRLRQALIQETATVVIEEQTAPVATLHVSVLASDLSLDQGHDRPVRRPAPRSSTTAATCSSACEQTMERLAAGSALLREAGQGALPGHPALLPDHRRRRRSPGRCSHGRRARRSSSSRSRSSPALLRRRRRPLPRDDAQGQAVPADAAAGARLLPVAPAPRRSKVAA